MEPEPEEIRESMKLPLKWGVPLLLFLLAGIMVSAGPERMVLLMLAMGVALWSAFSIPHPGPKRKEDDPSWIWPAGPEEGSEPPPEPASAPEGTGGEEGADGGGNGSGGPDKGNGSGNL